MTEYAELMSDEERRAFLAPVRREPTHCINGHALDEENTYTNALGHRRCRRCEREWQAKSRKIIAEAKRMRERNTARWAGEESPVR